MRYLYILILVFSATSTFAQEDKYLIKRFPNHKSEISALAISPNCKFIAVASENKDLILYDLDSHQPIQEHKDNYFAIKDIEFFGNKQLFVTAGTDIKLIDLENNKLALYEGNTTHIWSVDFAPERNKITAGSYDRKIRVWDVASTNIDIVLDGHEKSTLPVAFSPDEKYIVSGSLDQTIKVWNGKTGELINTLERHTKNIYDVKFHPNARYFASASDDKTIRLWDIELGEPIKTYIGHDAAVIDIEFSPDGYFLYSASLDGQVILWEVSTGNKIYSYIDHVGPVNEIAVSSDGNFVATGGKDGNVFLYQSAKVIAVKTNYGEKIDAELNNNPVFDKKRKGETKEEFDTRQIETKKIYYEIIDKYFELYEKSKNYKKLPE